MYTVEEIYVLGELTVLLATVPCRPRVIKNKCVRCLAFCPVQNLMEGWMSDVLLSDLLEVFSWDKTSFL